MKQMMKSIIMMCRSELYEQSGFFNELEIYKKDDYPALFEIPAVWTDICSWNRDTFWFRVTGVLLINNIPVVVFPKTYTVPENTGIAREYAGDLLRVLLRYRSEPFLDKAENKLLYGDDELQSGRISSALQLIDDYRRHGYLNRDTGILSRARKGRIDWPATINKTVPVFSHGQPAYFSPLMRYEKMDTRNAVHLIHRYVVSDCYSTWSWLSGTIADVESKDSPPFSNESSIRILNIELMGTYVQREVEVIKLMIAYLTSKNGTDSKRKLDIIATKYFSFVWEAVCAYLFHNQYSRLRSIIPQPEWESDRFKGKISQRPDIFTLHGDALYILDAKYYNVEKNLPGWHDVVKQMFYRHTLKNSLINRHTQKILPDVKEVYNIFLLPGYDNKPLSYAGRVYVRE